MVLWWRDVLIERLVNFESKFSSAFVHFGGRTLGAKDIREDEKGIIIIRDLCSS